MSTPRFAIYYADGSVFEGGGPSDDLVPVTLMVSRDWLGAPGDRVVGVVFDSAGAGRSVVHGSDFFFPIESGEYGNSDHLGAWTTGKLSGAVKFGEWVSSDIMGRFFMWLRSYARIARP